MLTKTFTATSFPAKLGNPERLRSQTKIHRGLGFTLLEVLIALFVFSILALILSSTLHNVINIQSGTDKSAERLRNVQFALLLMSRDVEQSVDRPILNASGKQEAAFVGKGRSMEFTHTGIAASPDSLARSNMQRAEYIYHDNALWRNTWFALDQAPDAEPGQRKILDNVRDVHFEYLDEKNRVHKEWPVAGQSGKQPLPRAVRVYLTIPNWGSMSQLYVIPTQPGKQVTLPPGA